MLPTPENSFPAVSRKQHFNQSTTELERAARLKYIYDNKFTFWFLAVSLITIILAILSSIWTFGLIVSVCNTCNFVWFWKWYFIMWTQWLQLHNMTVLRVSWLELTITKEGGCTFYQNRLWSEIVWKNECTSFEGQAKARRLISLLC